MTEKARAGGPDMGLASGLARAGSETVPVGLREQEAKLDEIARALGFLDWPTYLGWWHRNFYGVEPPDDVDLYAYTLAGLRPLT